MIAIAALVKSSFGSMKIANDISLTAVAALMALLEMGHLIGIREGTLASALMIGLFAKWIDQLINRRTVKVQPARGPELISRRSLQILDSVAAMVFTAPETVRIKSEFWKPSKRLGLGLTDSPSSAEIAL